MIKINYFDERELLVRRDRDKGTETKGTQVLPLFFFFFSFSLQVFAKLLKKIKCLETG